MQCFLTNFPSFRVELMCYFLLPSCGIRTSLSDRLALFSTHPITNCTDVSVPFLHCASHLPLPAFTTGQNHIFLNAQNTCLWCLGNFDQCPSLGVFGSIFLGCAVHVHEQTFKHPSDVYSIQFWYLAPSGHLSRLSHSFTPGSGGAHGIPI